MRLVRRKHAFAAQAAGVFLSLQFLAGCTGSPKQPREDAADGTVAVGVPRRYVEQTTTPSSSTADMADLLRTAAQQVDLTSLTTLVNEERAKVLEQQITAAHDPAEREKFRRLYAMELLLAGKTQVAIDQFAQVAKSMDTVDPSLRANSFRALQLLQATAYLRLGEDQNCCTVDGPDACLIPIRGSGVHTRKNGSLKAMELFAQILRAYPEDHRAKWLLNVAAMTLGQYPGGVPAKWRIDPKIFTSSYDIGRFPNIAPQLGLNLLGLAGGAAVEDFDGDGHLDIFVSDAGLSANLRFFHNNGDATFTDRTKQAKLTGLTGGLNLTTTDYNNDGHTDVFVLRGGWMGKAAIFPCSLLRNNGDGTFTDVTKQAGLMRVGPTQTAVWLDYDNNGLLDVFIGFEGEDAAPHACALYRNNGDGTFTDAAVQAGVNAVGFVKGVASADYDNDGWPDLFLSAQGSKALFRNNRDGTFTDETAKSGINGPAASFGTFFFDYDSDGWQDLFVMDYSIHRVEEVMLDIQGIPVRGDRSRLFRNNRDGTFADVSKEVHLDKLIWGMGLNFGDLDNDGFPDIYAATGNPELTALVPNRMFRNAGGKEFQEVTYSGNFGHLQKGHGVSFADINNDGQQDVFVKMGGTFSGDKAFSSLYANPGHSNRWLCLKLEGVTTNRAAIGARIKVTVKTPDGMRVTHTTVGSGGSFGCNPFRREIGLGDARSIETVEIFWPVSKTTQVLRGLEMDRFYNVREGSNAAVPQKIKATPWPTTNASRGLIHLRK